MTAPVGRMPRRGLRRTGRFFTAFLAEQRDPARLYTMMATDAVATLGAFAALDGARVLDVGGSSGYVADAFRQVGATCWTVDRDPAELQLHGRAADLAIVADGRRLPTADATFDIVHCSNVLEHVTEPETLVHELVRVARPDGLIYLSFTPWWSPWGGHEISPWHYFGAERATRRYERSGRRVKNRFGTSLHRTTVTQGLRLARRSAATLVSARPRYSPGWGAPIVRIPGVREVLTWNLELILRASTGAQASGGEWSRP